ncbi:MAG: DUF4147 domain-containing protein [Planctomycetota bacterium]|nr:MAG: DUF4147 domain-containing protein [Planctomycetota bacterium]
MEPLDEEALAIWRAAVRAVDSERLVRQHVRSDGDTLHIAGRTLRAADHDRLVVVGAGKAGAGMAAAFEAALAPRWLDRLEGWVNVPAPCVRPLQRIHLHPARPAGRNEPTEEAVRGTRRILRLVRDTGPRDVCVVLLSGGGSALLTAPLEGITLRDMQLLTRALMESGADIRELNCVRKQLSAVKGGKLALSCGAGTLITLIISDVIGDPLDVIASGPTYPDATTPEQALAVLKRHGLDRDPRFAHVVQFLRSRAAQQPDAGSRPRASSGHGPEGHSGQGPRDTPWGEHVVIGNNRTAVQAAADEARRRGWRIAVLEWDVAGEAESTGRRLLRTTREIQRAAGGPAAIISGGEPTVILPPYDGPRRGGRNQQLVLAALCDAWDTGLAGLCLLSGGTDGEDGPTDAAGAIVDETRRERARAAGLDPTAFLRVANAYPFFERIGGLIKTGPTHTNVMDVRVALALPRRPAGVPQATNPQ